MESNPPLTYTTPDLLLLGRFVLQLVREEMCMAPCNYARQ